MTTYLALFIMKHMRNNQARQAELSFGPLVQKSFCTPSELEIVTQGIFYDYRLARDKTIRKDAD